MSEPFTIASGHDAYVAIEADLLLVEAAAETLHALYAGRNYAGIAQAVWFMAKGLEDAAGRIRETLEGPNTDRPDAPVAAP